MNLVNMSNHPDPKRGGSLQLLALRWYQARRWTLGEEGTERRGEVLGEEVLERKLQL